ncbi:ATP-dependent zinc protease [Marinimicrobium sp. C6131]|uniref:ATP-dependent zinc protease family protein n=1 Tax=Marinimicrobium sp. C6131 TaxID=3022676 RepID=UPI00223E00B6|nr:ATP-dependent zinc protease [Marinimicrobium sp. C6131]UZJ43636.1 ATP-dependent zinc protease [Marinimicrobium sp. C6131]
MNPHPLKWIALVPLLAALSACSSHHVMVKKADMEAANQCLLAQQQRDLTLEQQQQQIAETLDLLRQSIELQQHDDEALRDLMDKVREGREEGRSNNNCPQGLALPVPSDAMDKKVVGAKERVLLTDLGIVLQSRVDTGATTSSMDARDIEIFERNGEEWVRFKIHDPDLDQLVELERPRSRKVRIIQASSEDVEKRPVVEMRITMGSLTQTAEFTLSDRSHMEFPLLIGRNVLRDVMLVDVARDNITEPKPPKPSDIDKSTDE